MNNSYTYSINLFENMNDCKGAKVCKRPNVNLGSTFNSSLSDDGSGFTLQFDDGTCESKSDSKVTTLLQFKCGKYMGSPELIDEFTTSKDCVKIFEFVTNEACKSAPTIAEVPCYLYNGSKKFDLTPLIKTEGGYEVTSYDSKHSFYINVCRDIKPEKASGNTATCPSGAACQTSKDKKSPAVSIGSVSTQSLPVLSRSKREIVMIYNGTKMITIPGCKGFPSTKITFVCPQFLHQVSGKGPVMTSTDNCMYEVFWETEYACPEADRMSNNSCILSNKFVDFDLTPLQKPAGHNYRVQDKDKKYTYYINVCKSTNIPNCIPSGYNASVCQEIADSNQVLSLGVFYEETLTFTDGQLVLSYKGGKTCHNGFKRETIINFKCNPTIEQGNPVFSGELIHCVYFFEWETRYACPPTRRTGSACRATSGSGNRYDLSELISPNASNWLAIDGESSSSSKMLYINVCGKLNKQAATSKCNNAAAACLIDKKDGSVKSLGRYYTPPILNPDNSLTLNYTNGDECIKGVKRRTVVTFVCHHGDLTSPPILVSHSQDDCTYTIMWKTAVACQLGINVGKNCKVEDKVAGYVFDFNAMQTHQVMGKYYFSLHVGKYKYYLKVCKDVNDTSIHCVNASACQDDLAAKKVRVIGRPNGKLYYHDGILKLKYNNGDKCSNGQKRQTHISFICKPDATSQGDGIPEFDREDHCVYHFRWPTKYACPAQTIECAARSNDNQYDLSSLVKTDDNWQSASSDGTFYINVCRSLNLKPDVSECRGTSAICLKKTNGDVLNLGQVDSALKVTAQGTITITYTKGPHICSSDKNKFYQSEILFICKKGATDTAPVYQSIDKCTYKFRWETAAACAITNVVGANCSVQDPKSDTIFNLYPLLRTLDKPYVYNHPNGRVFTLNVCGNIKKDLCKTKYKDVNIGVCMTETDKTQLNIGVVSQQLAFEGETLVLTYRDGDRDVVNGFPRITKIRFYCDPTVTLGSPKYIEQASEKDGEVFYFDFKTSLACSAKQVQCSLTSSYGKYDLTPLGLFTGNWEAVDTRSKYQHLHYFINVCRPINPLPSSSPIKCPGGAIGACQIDHSLSKGHNLGYIQSNPIIASKNVVTLRYYGGDGCHSKYNRSTRINLSCSNFMGSPIFESESTDCEYVFSWQTPSACPLTRESGSNCVVKDRQYGYKFNLSPLKNKQFSVNVPRGLVYFGVCDKSSKCSGSNPAACFFVTNAKVGKALGDVSTKVTYFDQEISLLYTTSSSCSLLIIFECDQTQHLQGHGPKFESVQNNCQYKIRWPTNLACRPNTHVQCSKRIESSDKKTDLQYDFTPLSKPLGNWQALAKDPSKASFWINVCRPIVQTGEALQCPPTAGVCKVENPSTLGAPKRYHNLGSLTSGPVTQGNGIYLLYTGGDNNVCGNGKNASAKIRMECGKYAEAAPKELNVYQDTCQFEFLWLTKYACPINTVNQNLSDDCTAVNPVTNYKFDLNKLYNTTNDYEVAGQKNQYYLLNVCKQLVDNIAKPCGDTSGSCQLSKDTSFHFNAGNVDKHLAYIDGVLKLNYSGGDICLHSKTNRSTIISFVCNSTTSNNLGKPVFVAESNDCTYYVSWHTKLACERKVECSLIVSTGSTNTKYNLYKLSNDDHNWLVIPSAGSNQGSTFYINICKALVPMKGINCPAGASACMKTKDGKTQSLGRARDPPTVVNGNVIIKYYNENNQVSSSIELTCNQGSLGQPMFVSKDINVYVFTWATSAACQEKDIPDLKRCRVYDKSTEFYYDVSPLKQVSSGFITINADKGSTVYEKINADKGSMVYATVCGSLPQSGCEGAGVCWKKDAKTFIRLGLQKYMSMAYLHDENMLLMKYCDAPCNSNNLGSKPKVVSRIMFICDESISNTETHSLDSIDASGANIIWKTNLVCPPAQEQCVFNDNGKLFDLQLLSSRTKSWHYTTIKGDKFWLNICRGINDQAGCPRYATVCAQLGDNKKILVLGYGKTQRIDKSTPSDQQILVHYTGQTNVPGCTHQDKPAQVLFQMICGHHVGKPSLKHVDLLSCTFTFVWTTVAACQVGSQKKDISMSNCRATHPVTNRVIDFTKIDNGPITVTNNKNTYKFRICGKLPSSLGGNCANKWVCKDNTGYEVTATKLYYEDYAFELWFVTKATCDKASDQLVMFIINFQCSDSVKIGKPVFEYKSASCHFVFTWSTSIVCTKDQSGVIIDTASTSSGSSAGKKAGIAFAVILVLLLVAAVVFVLHNQRRRQALVLFVRHNARKVRRRNGESSNAVYKYQKITVENEDDVDLLLGFSDDEEEEEEDREHQRHDNDDQEDEEMITL